MMKDTGLLNDPGNPSIVAGPREDRPNIWASEVGDFAYCARSWWLRRFQRVAAKTPEMAAGIQVHGLVGHRVAKAVVLERVIRACVVLVLLIAAVIGYLWLIR